MTRRTPRPALCLPGMACAACGGLHLTIFAPGTAAARHGLVGRLNRGVAARAWCSAACALGDRRSGWKAAA